MNGRNFDDYHLSEEVRKALHVMKFDTATEVQQEVIPKALEKQDLVVKAQTGSGKTAAFAIPLCELINWEERLPQALILSPTRELAVQVREDVTNIGRFKRIKALALYGKEPFAKQAEELRQRTHIVVGTPGRLTDHIERGTLNLDEVKYIVLDEADEMLNMGFLDEVEAIMKKVSTPRVVMVFSATLPTNVEKLVHHYMVEPVHIEVAQTGVTTDMIEHRLIEVEEHQKLPILLDVTVVENPDSCIIFCNTKERVETVFEALEEEGYPCERLHGGLEQEVRFGVMDGFKKGDFRYLVATDVAARGIDVDNITHIINYDVPMEKESYVHRTGRTGRAGNKGKAITLASSHEEKFVAAIERYIGFSIKQMSPPTAEKVTSGKKAFEETKVGRRVVRNNKTARINQNIMKLHFSGGKKKKLRPVDFVGTITNIPGVTAEDIGIITIKDTLTYVDILNGKGSIVLQAMEDTPIKGKKIKVSQAIK